MCSGDAGGEERDVRPRPLPSEELNDGEDGCGKLVC